MNNNNFDLALRLVSFEKKTGDSALDLVRLTGYNSFSEICASSKQYQVHNCGDTKYCWKYEIINMDQFTNGSLEDVKLIDLQIIQKKDLSIVKELVLQVVKSEDIENLDNIALTNARSDDALKYRFRDAAGTLGLGEYVNIENNKEERVFYTLNKVNNNLVIETKFAFKELKNGFIKTYNKIPQVVVDEISSLAKKKPDNNEFGL